MIRAIEARRSLVTNRVHSRGRSGPVAYLGHASSRGKDCMFTSTFRAHCVAPAFALCALLYLAGCASAPVGGGVTAPQLAVGDHWQYKVTDNLRRGAVSQLDVEVIAVSGRAARIRFDHAGASGPSEWIVDGEGGLGAGSLYHEPSRPFNPP